MEILLTVGIGIGLASIAGIRAFLPLVLVGIMARLGLFQLTEAFGLLAEWGVIGVLAALAVLESALDKVRALDSILDFVQTPVRIAAGALLFSAAMGAGLGAEAIPELAAGGAIAGVVSVLKSILRPPANVAAAGVSVAFLSACEDVVALAGGILAAFVPLVPLILVAFLLFFFYRLRRRRGRKYGGLRILGD